MKYVSIHASSHNAANTADTLVPLFAVDDNILVEGQPATAGSKMLESFIPLHDAEAVTRLKHAGYSVTGKTNVGEFGLDLLGETSCFGPVTDEAGNLIGAASALVDSGDVDCALNLDINGTPRRAAALSGAVFIKPTYGTVSRHGAIPCVCSAEQIGVTAKTSEKAADVLRIIAGHDEKDGTTLNNTANYDFIDARGLKIFIANEFTVDADREAIKAAEAALLAAGATITRGVFPMPEAIRSAWHIIMCAEACSNLSRYDGVKYGYRAPEYQTIDQLYTASRSDGLGLGIKSIILYGSDALSKDRYRVCYDRALRVRRAAHEVMTGLLNEHDVFLLPACSKPRYSAGGLDTIFDESLYTAPASITGFPAVALRRVQLIAAPLRESLALSAARVIERSVRA